MKGKLPAHTMEVNDFDTHADLLDRWVNGPYQLLIDLGNGGSGKTETLRRLMTKAHGPEGKKWGYVRGHISPLALYRILYDYRHFPIIFDDVDTLFNNEVSVSLLKAVCDTSKVKRVQWDSTHSVFKSELPRSFNSISRVAIITNSWEKWSQNISALQNRGVVVLFRPTALEVHQEIGVSSWFVDREVWDFIGRHLHLMTTPSFRFYLHAAAHKEAGTDWREKTLRMLTFDLPQGESPDVKEKLIAVARILSNPGFTTEQQREEAFAELFPRGGSRPTYYRFKKRLQDQVGTFDVQAVQGVVWADFKKTGDVQTEYDEQQARLRRQLEQQRHDIEQAGGVTSDDDDDDAAA